MRVSELQRAVLNEVASVDDEWLMWEDWYSVICDEPPNSVVTRLRGCGRPTFSTFRALHRRGLIEGDWRPNLHVRITERGREAIAEK